MKPTGVCNKEGHLIKQGVCITCDLSDEQDTHPAWKCDYCGMELTSSTACVSPAFKGRYCSEFCLTKASYELGRIKEPNYSEITKATLDYVEWKNKKKKNKFTKADSNKPNLAILFDTGKALEQVANVMSYGAEKYSRENWREVDDTERYVSATLRHLMAYCRDEKLDSESGMNHLAHAVCSLLFLLELDD